MRYSRDVLVAMLLLLLWTVPLSATPIQWPIDEGVLSQSAERIQFFLAKGSALRLDGIRLSLPVLVSRFYKGREFKPAWVDRDGVLVEATELLQVLKHSEDEGLPTKDYPIDVIEHYLSHNIKSPLQLAKIDLLLTDSFLHYSRNVRSGRLNPTMAGGEWFLPYTRFDASPFLAEALRQHTMNDVLAEMPPSNKGYRRLRAELRRYQDVAALGGWQQLARGKSLTIGSKEQRVVNLRKRLQLSGDLMSDPVADPELYDSTLNEAVQHFQLRHGMKADGVVGERTRAELNLPVKTRIHQIEANMERWRWLPNEMPENYIMINLAGYLLDVIKDDEPTMTMRVIVGRYKRQTPVFSNDVTSILLNPAWDVPPTIFREDILPQLRRNPARLDRLHLRLLSGNGSELSARSIDWTKVSAYHSPYTLHQDPGPLNPLGRIKFLLHDSNGIYLHDTPERHLFDQPNRALSSGCIRLEHPFQLALYLLADTGQWSRASLEAEIDHGKTMVLPLSKSIPIYTTYWTAWVDKDGVLQRREDVYHRDRRLLKLWRENAT